MNNSQLLSQELASTLPSTDQGNDRKDEDLFNIIERGDHLKLQSYLKVTEHSKPETCLRFDRHFSAFTFACYANSTECFKVLYNHAQQQSHSQEALLK